MPYRAEFDPANGILLMRVEGRITEESLTQIYQAVHTYSIATDARAGIWDWSSTTEVAVSAEFIRQLARQGPAMPDATNCPSIIVAPTMLTFGISRMFQSLGGSTRPLQKVVHTMDEALAELGVQSPHFEPLD
jgi:hypothetical protein